MLKCRMLEERIRVLTKRNRSIGIYTGVGQEAVAAGVGLDLLPGDTLAPSHRGYIPCFVKGLPLDTIIGRIASALSPQYPKQRPRYASLKLIPPSFNLGAQLERALGAAVANKKSRNKKIAVAFCGNSDDTAGHLQRALRLAGGLNLPVLLVCHSDSAAGEICQQAQDFGFPGVTVDGDDAVAVYRVATEAMAHARRGSGPTLIECKPWILSGQASTRRHSARNPILRMEEYLTRKGLFDQKLKTEVVFSFRRELGAAVKAAGGALKILELEKR